MAITVEEIKNKLNTDLQNFGTQLATSLVKYVDGREAVLKEELVEEITKNLSNIEGLGEQLEKIKEMADAFAKAFDENEDGTITPEEILAKATLLQKAIDGVNVRVDTVEASIEDVKKAIEAEIEDLKERVGALEINVSKNTSAITEVKAELATNYFTKDDVNEIIAVDFNVALDSFNKVLFPEPTDDTASGDGAVE